MPKPKHVRRTDPILSLRLLGNLDTELSCTNSRFFRTTLYSNAEISQYLHNDPILHWQSVRPVPKITIDYGDGRTIERTITGNSIHYVLSPDGQVIDALPGLYAATFLAILKESSSAVIGHGITDDSVRAYQSQQLAALQAAWNDDLPAHRHERRSSANKGKGTHMTQRPADADLTTASKSGVERTLLKAVVGGLPLNPATVDEQTWGRIANLHQNEASLDASSIEMVRAKHPLPAEAAGELAISKLATEDPLVRVILNFERSIAEDTVRNQYVFRTQILAWLIEGKHKALDVLNEKVYAELFLTPSSDPWLGLVPPDTYAAIEESEAQP